MELEHLGTISGLHIANYLVWCAYSLVFYMVIKTSSYWLLKMRINSIRSRCNTPVLHPPIRACHISFLNFVSHFKISSPTHTIISFKNNEKPKKKITQEKTGSRERGGRGEREVWWFLAFGSRSTLWVSWGGDFFTFGGRSPPWVAMGGSGKPWEGMGFPLRTFFSWEACKLGSSGFASQAWSYGAWVWVFCWNVMAYLFMKLVIFEPISFEPPGVVYNRWRDLFVYASRLANWVEILALISLFGIFVKHSRLKKTLVIYLRAGFWS